MRETARSIGRVLPQRSRRYTADLPVSEDTAMIRAARRKFLRSLLLSAAGVALCGCGQKGPLYLPEEELKKKKKEKSSQLGGKSPARA